MVKLKEVENMKKYDVAIIGSGASGLSAAIYAQQAGLSAVIIEKDVVGGQIRSSAEIRNYPGFEKISGESLAKRMHEHATKLGVETLIAEASSINFEKMNNIITTSKGKVKAATIILSTGAKPRMLNCPGEEEFSNKGITYSTVCDGAPYKGKKVVVIGGGDTAIENAIYFSNICKSVTISTNLPSLICDKTLLKEFEKTVAQNKNVTVMYNTKVDEVYGDKKVKGVKFSSDNNKKTDIKVNAVFVAIGRVPQTKFVRNKINLDEKGYIAINNKFETNVAGVYAIGDVRVNGFRQVVTACADGAVAAIYANHFILSND